MQNESRYKPWVPRRPPLFNRTLDTLYLKLSSAVCFILLSLAVGLLAGYTASGGSIRIPHLTFDKANIVNASTQKPIATVVKPVPAAAPQTVMVPAIPMDNHPDVKLDPPLKPAVAAEDYLKDTYQISTYDAGQIIKASKEAGLKTGIDPTLIIAIAAKYSRLKLKESSPGMMNVVPQSHPDELKILNLEKISPASVDGALRLGAEILATYKRESANDIDQALRKYVSKRNQNVDVVTNEIMDTKKQLDTLKLN